MRAKGVGNGRIAEVAGVHTGTVTQWLGNKFPPADEKLDAIARELGVTKAWLRYGENGSFRERPPEYSVHQPVSQLVFASPTAQQRAKVWLEQFLLELAEEGATQDFIDSSRRLLMNSANYEHGFGAAAGHVDAMDDDQKLRHMQALAVGIRAALKDRQKKGKRS